MERRLAAILAADVVGYSRLVGADEEGTLAALRTLRVEYLEPLIARHKGRVVKLMGDGILAEFQSAVDAVRCAVAWQKASVAQPGSTNLRFRIGINLGDIVIEGDDILGDGVNVAARLEQLAPPGGICLSEDVHRQVAGKLDEAFDDLGEQWLKNLARPLRVFGVRLDGQPTDGGSPTTPAARAPSRSALAVLPFTNLSGDPEQDYFADGIAEDIIVGLSRYPDIDVISRSSTFTYKGKSLGARDIGKDLRAQYVLEGSVRKVGDRVRITAQLVDAETGSDLWGDRFDRHLDDVLAIQDEVVGAILHALGAADGVLERSARERARSSSVSPSAYDCFLQGREYFYRPGDAGFDTAEALFEKAIALDQSFARAYSALAWLHFLRFKLFRTHSFESIRAKSRELALHATQLDRNDFRAHWVLGGLFLHEGKLGRSLSEFDRALSIRPNDANVLASSGEPLIYSGREEEALERCERAIRLNPKCPDWYFWIMGSALFHLGRYEETVNVLERMSGSGHAGRLLAATYAFLGRDEEARSEVEAFMRLVPGFSISEWAKTEHYADRKKLERYVEGQRLAGFPE